MGEWDKMMDEATAMAVETAMSESHQIKFSSLEDEMAWIKNTASQLFFEWQSSEMR